MDVAQQGEGALRAHDQWWLSACGGFVRAGASGTGDVMLVQPSGLLAALPAGDAGPSSTGWRPACVLVMPKPRREWTAEESQAVAAARTPAERRDALPSAMRLLGAWHDIKVYPDAWAHKDVPLSQFTAANSRQLLTAYAAGAVLIDAQPEYLPGDAVRPLLWRDPARPDSTGLAAVEASWVQQQQHAVSSDDGARTISEALRRLGMQLGQPARTRPPPKPRVAPPPQQPSPRQQQGHLPQQQHRPQQHDGAGPSGVQQEQQPLPRAAATLAAAGIGHAVSATQARPQANAPPIHHQHQHGNAHLPGAQQHQQPPPPQRTAAPPTDTGAGPVVQPVQAHPQAHTPPACPPRHDGAGPSGAQQDQQQQQRLQPHVGAAHAVAAAAAAEPPPYQPPHASTTLGKLAADVAAMRQHISARGPVVATQRAKYPWAWVWKVLPVPRRVKVFAVRLLHAALPCRAMHAAKQRIRDREFALCQCCGGRDAQGRLVPETYTHLFMHCPAFAPAITWLQDLWEAISGHRPPSSPDVIITGQPGPAWPQAPEKTDAALWHALRISLLANVWACRCADDTAERNAHTAVRLTIEGITADIKLQYNRSYHTEQLQRSLPPRVLRMKRRRPAADTLSVWLRPQLASLQANPSGPQSPQRLITHLSMTQPIAAPLPPEPH